MKRYYVVFNPLAVPEGYGRPTLDVEGCSHWDAQNGVLVFWAGGVELHAMPLASVLYWTRTQG